ncbi:type I restriction enzyme HsdR N-terminal domain-containing protein [Inquilinus limosus]
MPMLVAADCTAKSNLSEETDFDKRETMDLSTRLVDLQKKVVAHREILLTEEAAKTALVMPFIQALGYDVFNPGEVVPEFTADVGTKKGEKVDYAICKDGRISILIECKPSSAELSLNHASQLFRYFSVTDARLAVLTNGVVYQFYSDVDRPNKMDEKPFYTFSIEASNHPIQRYSKNSASLPSTSIRLFRKPSISRCSHSLEKSWRRNSTNPRKISSACWPRGSMAGGSRRQSRRASARYCQR